jgi:CO/xanthine dehydrogenase FAD-binding subunit
MKPPRFHYERPESLSGALDLLAEEGDRAKVLAGGQSLVALMNLRLAFPEIVADIGRIDDLRYVKANGSAIAVGALTTQAVVERDPVVAERCPLLASAIRHIGHEAIRNRGTVGGSIAHADPAAELPVVLSALEGWVVIRSRDGSRRVAPADFFRGFLTTAVEANELVTEIAFPAARNGQRFAFEEFARRPGDFALVSVACRVDGDPGSVESARVVLGGVGEVPCVVDGLDDLGGLSAREAIDAAGEAAARIEATADIHGTREYRRHLARGLVRRAMARALAKGH